MIHGRTTRLRLVCGLTLTLLAALLISASSATGSATTDAGAALRCGRIPASSVGRPIGAFIQVGYGTPLPSWCVYKPSSKPLEVNFTLQYIAEPTPAGASAFSLAFVIHGKATPFIGGGTTTSVDVLFRRRGKYPYRFRHKNEVTGAITTSEIFGYFIVK